MKCESTGEFVSMTFEPGDFEKNLRNNVCGLCAGEPTFYHGSSDCTSELPLSCESPQETE